MSDQLFNYENSFVCFLDVLGFRSFVEDKEKVENYFQLIGGQIRY